MLTWFQLPDGRLINFDNILEIHQDGNFLKWMYRNQAVDVQDYGDFTTATAALSEIRTRMATGPLFLTLIYPNNAASGGGGAEAVLKGSGFAGDFVGLSFPTINIGAQATAETFIDDNTVLLTFNTALAPAIVDVIYTTLGGKTIRLVNGYTFT
jgi:hypothetical protein